MRAHEFTDNSPKVNPGEPISFPAGTSLVDVSDVYDWYKLGMVMSNLKDADPRMFNQGVPHTIIAMGSEEEEAKIRPLLKRLGFNLHDIDKPGDVKKAMLARDVIAKAESIIENFADGKKPGRKGLAKRSGVNCKASVTSLRKTAKNSSGEKRRMAHWCANMKSGRNK
jgi:hypothetical protein